MNKIVPLIMAALIPATATAQWTHTTETDPTTGVSSCVVRHASHAPGWPVVAVLPGHVFAWPDGERAMGAPVSIRVDTAPERTGAQWITASAAQHLVDDLTHGQQAVSRHTDDGGQVIETTADLRGIAEALAACITSE